MRPHASAITEPKTHFLIITRRVEGHERTLTKGYSTVVRGGGMEGRGTGNGAVS